MEPWMFKFLLIVMWIVGQSFCHLRAAPRHIIKPSPCENFELDCGAQLCVSGR